MTPNHSWPKHPDKEIEYLLREMDRQGWRISRRRKYYWALCPCGDHKKVIHVTPSNPNYIFRLNALLLNQTCFEWGE